MNYDALYSIVYFLLWLEYNDPNAIWGGHYIRDVVDNLAILMDTDPDKLRRLREC